MVQHTKMKLSHETLISWDFYRIKNGFYTAITFSTRLQLDAGFKLFLETPI